MKGKVHKLFSKAAVGMMTAAVLSSSVIVMADETSYQNVLLAETEQIEYMEPTTETAYAIMDLDPFARSTYLEWTVLANNRLESVAIHIEAGQYLRIAGAADPDTSDFKFGYTDHNTDWYCNAQGSFAHSFQIEETGDYHIFFRNLEWFSNLHVDFIYEVFDN